VENTIVSNTVIGGYGGGVCIYESTPVLIRNDVSFNEGRDGGGLYMHNSSDPTFDGNIVTFNTAVKGGGIYLEAGVTLTNTVVVGNQASDKGSGLYVATSSSRLLQTTVARQLDGDGIGVYAVGNVYMENTIVASNTVGIFVSADKKATLEATLWGNDEWANGENWSGAGSVSLGAISIEGDPCFANPDEGNYHICSTSAARDAGVDTNVTEDIDGDTRPDGSAYDIGADEFQLNPVTDLQVVSIVTDSTTLTATLNWIKSSNVTTYTLRYSSTLVTDENWASATVITDSLSETADTYTAVVPYSGGNVFFALKYWTACGDESPVSGNVFWPSKKVYLPLVLRNAP
jgi:parallel beta-helix repeat protein